MVRHQQFHLHLLWLTNPRQNFWKNGSAYIADAICQHVVEPGTYCCLHGRVRGHGLRSGLAARRRSRRPRQQQHKEDCSKPLISDFLFAPSKIWIHAARTSFGSKNALFSAENQRALSSGVRGSWYSSQQNDQSPTVAAYSPFELQQPRSTSDQVPLSNDTMIVQLYFGFLSMEAGNDIASRNKELYQKTPNDSST